VRIFSGENWTEGFLDYSYGPDEVRIKPVRWLNVADVRSQYFVREKSWRLVVNYIREVGLGATLRKIRSRSAEAHRNEKFLSIGVGEIIDVGINVANHQKGDFIGFIASNHPKCVERVVVNSRLIFSADRPDQADSTELSYIELGQLASKEAEKLSILKGWSQHSGNPLPVNLSELFTIAVRALSEIDWGSARRLETGSQVVTHQASAKPAGGRGRKTAVLYGYGNYAKTMCLPNVSKYVDIAAVHEIDPTQMPRPLPTALSWDSGYLADDSENYDVYLIAGYHHTHAPLAEYALQRGSYAVVEKPVVTTFEQLDALKSALEVSSAGLYSGFHKRYARYNDWIFADLGVEYGDPISMHSIVFEVPLPGLHWYRWKNSCGRVVANGCHWIDHFLFMNDFSPVTEIDVYVAPDETINATVVLDNGALFTMVLTDRGSDRLGVQNNVEFRNDNGTVRVINDGAYFAESHDRILRKKKINRLDTYGRMYRSIALDIAEGGKGDSVASLVTSAGLILEIEKQAQAQLTVHAGIVGRNAN